MKNFFTLLKSFFIEIKNEPKIPSRDKKIIVIILLIITIPVLIIPDWISTYGFIISLILFSFIPDYFFNILDQQIVLAHYPFDLKSYNSIKRGGQFLANICPTFISDFLWEYEKEII